MSEPTYHYLTISCADEAGSGIGLVQGAGFEPEEARRRFDEIPARPLSDYAEGENTVVLDYLDANKDIVDTKFIHPSIAAEILDITEDEVFRRAWENLAKRNSEARAFIEKLRAEKAAEQRV